MKVVITDGGRGAVGFKGETRDCVTRSIAIATEQSYESVYKALSEGCRSERGGKSRSARNGVKTSRKWFKDYMASLGWEFVATMGVGTGCKVHLRDGELPMGRLIISLSKHYTVVIDGIIYDNHNPQRDGNRCVYGYWKKRT